MSVVILPETSCFIGPNQLFSLKPRCIWRSGERGWGLGGVGGSKRV